MTKLETKVTRETGRHQQGRPVIVTLAPAGSQNEALIGFRLKGTRTQYVLAVSTAYQHAALVYANKEKAAKKAARQSGVKWNTARRQFIAENSL